MIDHNTVVRTASERCRLHKGQDHAKLAPNEVGEVLWRAGGFVFVKGQIAQRCVRGIPLTKELWLSGDGRAGEQSVKPVLISAPEEAQAARDVTEAIVNATLKLFHKNFDTTMSP